MARPSRKKRRSYDNSLRQSRAEQTRTDILEAMAAELGDVPVDELSVSRIAERAGVSEPTVYRHFPNRQALLDGFTERWNARPPSPAFDGLPDQLDRTVPELFGYFEANRRMVVAANQTHSLASKMDAPARAKRTRAFYDMLSPLVEHLDPQTADGVRAVLRQIYSARMWVALVEDAGLETDQAADAVQWVLRTLLAELKRGKSRAGRDD